MQLLSTKITEFLRLLPNFTGYRIRRLGIHFRRARSFLFLATDLRAEFYCSKLWSLANYFLYSLPSEHSVINTTETL
jgi:hypothetical protein